MKYLAILFIAFPLFSNAATVYDNADSCYVACRGNRCVVSYEDGQYYCIAKRAARQEKAFHDTALNQRHPIIICSSKSPLSDPSRPPIECVNSKENRIRSDLASLYTMDGN